MADRTVPRIVVTGLGTVNPLGGSVPDFERALRAGVCAIGPLTLFDAEGYRSRMAAQVLSVPPATVLSPSLRRRASRVDTFALVAAGEAIADAALDITEAPERIGVALGGTTGGALGAEGCFRDRIEGRLVRYRPSPFLAGPISTSAEVVAAAFALRGPRITLSTACSSSANAIGIALDWIRLGRADAVVAGGSEGFCRMIFAGFNALHAMSREPCRPFDRRRDGLSLGEGAAVMVIESEDLATRRGARIHAELCGYGASADAHHLTAPHPDGTGAILAMRRALARAGLEPGAIDYINAHGTGTPLNDAIEIAAIKAVFGSAARRLAVSSTKGAVGHTLGAAGAIEALATILALRDGFLPPTVNLEEPDPACDLDCVPMRSRSTTLRYALSNSYGFGGNNTTLVLGRA